MRDARVPLFISYLTSEIRAKLVEKTGNYGEGLWIWKRL